MYIIISVQGCFPNINIEINENGETKIFDTPEQAREWAKENCAWEYRIVKW